MRLAAYADESYDLSLGVCLFTASMVDLVDAEALRAVLNDLRTGRSKLHWSKEPPSRDREGGQRAPGRERGGRGSREASGATMLYVESRQARSNKLDQETVLICRRKRLISHHMHVEFLPGSAEPLLWIPDIVCGAALAAQRSETSYLEQLADRVMTIDVDGR